MRKLTHWSCKFEVKFNCMCLGLFWDVKHKEVGDGVRRRWDRHVHIWLCFLPCVSFHTKLIFRKFQPLQVWEIERYKDERRGVGINDT